MRALLCIFGILIGSCLAISTIQVGDFISPPAWLQGSIPAAPGYQFVNGVGAYLNQTTPILVFKNNDGTYSSVTAQIQCESDLLAMRIWTNGKIFYCGRTVFELDGRNIVNVKTVDSDSLYGAVMADDTLVSYTSKSGEITAYEKVGNDWQSTILMSVGTYKDVRFFDQYFIVVTPYAASKLYARQPDKSWNLVSSFTGNIGLNTGFIYAGDNVVISGADLFDGYVYTPKPHTLNPFYDIQILAADSGVQSQLTTADLGIELMPSGGIGFGVMLRLDDNTVILAAPYDNYNLTRVQSGGSAFVFKKQQDMSWKIETKFVQSSPNDARLDHAVGYEDGRLYFVACRTNFVNGDENIARNECGFKYAEYTLV